MRQSFTILLFVLSGWVSFSLYSQNTIIEGFVKDYNELPLEFVNVAIQGTTMGTTTRADGSFSLRVAPEVKHTVIFAYLGYEQRRFEVELSAGEKRNMNVYLTPLSTTLPDVEVTDKQIISSQYIKIDPRLATLIPGPGSGVENLLKTMPGVSSSSELSSQYSVRGGNFDENLVYVNGIEIYRPFLVRSGQQEGLSFVNSNLVSSISFSAGGFDAQYGDKMASVLDITYKTPTEFRGSFYMSLLEGSLHIEDALADKRLTYLFGVRHKSNQYLLGTLDTQGDYKPEFTDVQTLVNYSFNCEWDLSFLGNYSRNQYLFRPERRETRFGSVFEEVRQFTVLFEGQERDLFLTALGALSLNYQPEEGQKFQLITSVFQTDETENFDIKGRYLLERVETSLGSSEFGQPVGTPLGAGSFHNHARNYLNAIVWNIEHKGEIATQDNTLKWGVKYQYEDIYDRLSEWTMVDSAGYALPRHPADFILLQDTVNTQIFMQSSRISGFVQNSWEFGSNHGRYIFTAGVRSNYWSYNNQWLVSPRATLLYKPVWAPRMVLRASGGLYHQPPFYKELRDFQGNLNPDIKAQESRQIVLGAEYNMQFWDRPFKYTGEIYYKQFKNLIPYELDNVRIRYYANNNAKGYGTGIDMKLNGEFVPGVESWASLSVMQTREIIEGTYYLDSEGNQVPLGYMPRPTDQRFAFSIFFQDFLPRNPTYKVNLALIYGSGLPISPPSSQKFRNPVYMPPYRRVDIGFSKELIGTQSSFGDRNPLRHINSMWIAAEVFNLLEINNTISYLWIKDVSNDYYAIPNFLTSRLINIKLIAEF
ncbi:MAG: TonB-dependent receptor [Bacteroidetes bacterium]|nr:MAG: TonB-dependent receptor [Bacteroidota bacterium]